MNDIINGQYWQAGDKFFRPIMLEGKWIVWSDTFKFLQEQYAAIEQGWVFRHNGDMISKSDAKSKCEQLVEILNKQ